MIDFTLGPDLEELRDRTREFVRDVVIPAETRDLGSHGPDEQLRQELQDQAKQAGLFAPQVATELGGLGLDARSMAVVFEEAGYSLLGPKRSTAQPQTKATCTCSRTSRARSSGNDISFPCCGVGPLVLLND